MAIKELLKESEEYYLDRAPKDIEKNRKGTFRIKVSHNGSQVKDAKIAYRLTRHDYDFGCNLFMLNQYDDFIMQETYLSQWKELFNTAVIPLYWEGTEPQQGRLRYDMDSPNDVYRRPPAATVVDYCLKNGIAMKGHPLFWHEFIPKWLPNDFEELFPLLEKRFREISERFGSKIPVFDCVNEPSRIWDMTYQHKNDGYKMIAPPSGYVERVFALGEKYFSGNELILNEATSAAFCDFRGDYSGYYLYLKELLGKGLKIDQIGLQCHVTDSPVYKNIFDAQRLYGVLDGYAKLNKPLVLSEIGLSCEDEELQAEATKQLYTIWFSHASTSGIFWWNLDDNGILVDKKRTADAENLPYGGLCRNGRPKAAYRVLQQLIKKEWHTEGNATCCDGIAEFRGFFGDYCIEVLYDGKRISKNVSLKKKSDGICEIEI